MDSSGQVDVGFASKRWFEASFGPELVPEVGNPFCLGEERLVGHVKINFSEDGMLERDEVLDGMSAHVHLEVVLGRERVNLLHLLGEEEAGKANQLEEVLGNLRDVRQVSVEQVGGSEERLALQEQLLTDAEHPRNKPSSHSFVEIVLILEVVGVYQRAGILLGFEAPLDDWKRSEPLTEA